MSRTVFINGLVDPPGWINYRGVRELTPYVQCARMLEDGETPEEAYREALCELLAFCDGRRLFDVTADEMEGSL